MTDYRMVARHVRYWRGAVHKWSTVYPFTGTLTSGNYAAAIAALATMEDKVNYMKSGEVSGGLYEIALYNQASGGVPIAVATYFPWATPGSWVPYGALGWSARTYEVNPAAEVAMQVEWPAGLSSSGKPVSFKKWYHSVPNLQNVPPAFDISTTDKTGLTTALTAGIAAISGLGIQLGHGSRLAATAPVIRQYFGNHQMPRGRRRRPVEVSSSFAGLPPGILIVPGSDGSLSS